jgi:ABC-type polar amino acid transport system ATPase subunit
MIEDRRSISPVLELKAVAKSFALQGSQPVRALDDITFNVARGEVVTLMGPSGSGKSTCLRVINGLETIDRGAITICGQNLADRSQPRHVVRRKTAMIFQHFELFPHLNVIENIRLAPRLTRGQTVLQATKKAQELLDIVGLTRHAQQYPARLSGGQKQRVAIARALAVEPEILLCDEPTSALDPELVGEVTSILARIASEGMTMILVTHEIRFAREVSSRCLFLESGKIHADLPVREFFASPEDRVNVGHASDSRHRLDQFLGRFAVSSQHQ